jgi:quercetin 2,3-dioxygenase
MQRRNFLFTVAAAVPAIAIGQNLKQPKQRTGKAFVIRTGKSRFDENIIIGKSPHNIIVSSKDTGSDLTVFEYFGNEKGGPPLHIHFKQDEIYFIIEGEYLFRAGNDTYILKPGDTIFLPRKVPHAFAQLTDTGKMFFMFQPSGKMEDFFRAVGKPNAQEQGEKIWTDHEMKVVGPPLEF